MKAYFFLVLIPFLALAEDKAPGCSELGSITQSLEQNLQSRNLAKENCEQLTAKDILPEGQTSFVPDDFIKEFRCQNLAAIELRLKTIESEQALLTGIAQLKNDLKVQKEKSAASLDAAKTFKDNLEIAQTFELVLKSNIVDDLKKVEPAKRSTLPQLVAIIKAYCKEGNVSDVSPNVCSPEFVPTQSALDELNGFLDVGNFDKTQVEKLKQALSIKKKSGDDYSFTQMRAELKDGLGTKDELTKKDLKVINSLPDFEDGGRGFLTALKNSKKELDDKVVTSRFKFLIDDLRKREEWEMNSKFSLIQFNYAKEMEGEPSKACADVPKSECLKALQKVLQGSDQAHIARMVKEFQHSEAYLVDLKKTADLCAVEVPGLPAECEKKIDENRALLVDQAQVLSALKERILKNGQELLTFRNFAVEKLQAMNCVQGEETNVGDCYDSFESNISKEATALAGSGLDISLVYAKPKEETKIDELCDKGTEKVYKKDRLCDYLDLEPGTDKKEAKNKPDPDKYNAPLSPGESNHTGDTVASASNFLMDVARLFGQRNMTPPPYPYPMYGQYPSSGGPMLGLSDSILYSARLQGYGSYVPTPTLAPYSSMGSLTAYKPYASSSGTYFNRPVGY